MRQFAIYYIRKNWNRGYWFKGMPLGLCAEYTGEIEQAKIFNSKKDAEDARQEMYGDNDAYSVWEITGNTRIPAVK
jgi:hypothetical protein